MTHDELALTIAMALRDARRPAGVELTSDEMQWADAIARAIEKRAVVETAAPDVELPPPGEYVTGWPPMRRAMARASYRKRAVLGLPHDVVGNPGELTRSFEPHETEEPMRLLLAGTDVPVEAMSALCHGTIEGFEANVRNGHRVDAIIAGIASDVFLIGFWTREALS